MWLDPLMAVQYVIYFQFVVDVDSANGPESKTTCFVQFSRCYHLGQSLPSPIALCVVIVAMIPRMVQGQIFAANVS